MLLNWIIQQLSDSIEMKIVLKKILRENWSFFYFTQVDDIIANMVVITI